METAAEIQAELAIKRFGGQSLRTRIGINTGAVVAGNVGAGERLHYTVHGDAVNVAARLEALNKRLGTYTLVSASTAEHLGRDYELQSIGEEVLPGKHETIGVYQLPQRA